MCHNTRESKRTTTRRRQQTFAGLSSGCGPANVSHPLELSVETPTSLLVWVPSRRGQEAL